MEGFRFDIIDRRTGEIIACALGQHWREAWHAAEEAVDALEGYHDIRCDIREG